MTTLGAEAHVKIWLADLTYTQQTIASDVIPASIAMIAEYVEAAVAGIPPIRLFKYPEKLCRAFEDDHPDIIGFSSYVWNSSLSLAFAREIRALFPDTLIVFGGPNFPMDPDEQRATLQASPWVDFFVVKEAEHAFARLVEAWRTGSADRDNLCKTVPNLVYLDSQGSLRVSPIVERLLNLEMIPSPYLCGRLDEFFDGRLLPVIQTARGCPFSCAFCTEGQQYWSKVRHKPQNVIRKEIVHIAERLALLPEEERRHDLLIADSNFGMFKQDLETCRSIAVAQDEYDYPKYINVATGKNAKKRVLEAARLVRGAMKLSGSVQSLDPTVQENMKRSNISDREILDMAMQSSEVGANTYSEVILALPGDTLEAHFATLRTLVDAGFNTISMYQLMILTGTEFGSEEAKRKYGMVLKYRVLPRCFGSFELCGRKINVAEIEEICVANNTLSFGDYLQCRKMNLLVNIFYNDGIFSELVALLKGLDISPWDWLVRIFEEDQSPAFSELTGRFVDETTSELWDDRADVAALVEDEGNIRKYISGDLGSNLIFKYKALSMTRYFDTVCTVALRSITGLLAERRPGDADAAALAEEICTYKRMQVEGLFDGENHHREGVFRFDVSRITMPGAGHAFDYHEFDAPRRIRFAHSAGQSRSIESYVRIFGNDTVGLTRILSRVFLKQLFRTPEDMGPAPDTGMRKRVADGRRRR